MGIAIQPGDQMANYHMGMWVCNYHMGIAIQPGAQMANYHMGMWVCNYHIDIAIQPGDQMLVARVIFLDMIHIIYI